MFSSGSISRMTRAPSSITPSSKPPHSSGNARSPWRLIWSSCSGVSLTVIGGWWLVVGGWWLVESDTNHQPPTTNHYFSLLPKFFAQILAGVVAKDGDDHAFVNPFGDPHRRDDVGRGRNPDEPAFAPRQSFDHRVRLLRGDFDFFIGKRRVVDARHDGRLHVLQSFEAVKRRIGLHRDQFDFGFEFAQTAPRSDESPARAESGDEVSDAPSGLVEYLDACRFVMGAPVSRVVVLVGVKIFVGIGGHDFAHGQDRAVRTGERIG